MKFARYLDDALTPEWKRAYIDYRGLKKRITAVRRAQENAEEENSSDRDPEVSDGVPTTATGFLTSKKGEYDPTLVAEISEEGFTPVASSSSAKNGDVPKDSAPTGAASDSEEDVKEAASPVSLTSPSKTDMAGKVTFSHTDQHGVVRESTPSGVQGHATGTPSRILNVVRRRSGSQVHRSMSSRTSFNSTPSSAVTLTGLLENMSSVQLAFFSKLDRELDKVEQFYIARETEAKERSAILRTQLTELKDHRRLYHELHSNSIKKWASAILPSSAERSSEAASRKFYQFTGRARRKIQRRPKAEGSREVDLEMDLAAPDGTKTPRTQAREEHTMSKFRLDPDEYQRARKRLKKAVLEYYRGLETLNNYRILNLTGFRKALKKFEKATKIPVQEVYMKEKVDTSAFSSGDIVQQILKDMEDQFAARFARGDKKRAMVRLRALSSHKSHHYSTFRTGLALGLAIPAFAYGLYESFQLNTRSEIPAWEILIFIYGALLVPVLFVLLIGVNLLVWNRARINYVFIFEIDVRSALDHREYFEIPAILLSTLCYAFWLSFARIGTNSVASTTWPAIWLLFTFLMMVNPLPIFSRSSRWWFIRNVARLLTSGAHRVEFTDFWLGDQFCSLIFTLGNLYLVVCAYVVGFDGDISQQCSKPRHWGVPFVLSSLPLLVRLVQSVKRYIDSKLITHLINGGKYGMGIVYYLCYWIWRHNNVDRGPSFVLFCLFGTIYTVYATSWDFLMDWSVLRPHAKHPLLRDEVVYTSQVPLYYCAILLNLLLRFSWAFLYIPAKGPSFNVRTFITGMLEMLRRWQWNFYRLENEHVGNVDQYRITREVPLPYSFDDLAHDSDVGDEDDETPPS